jgi:hypothetical protein
MVFVIVHFLVRPTYGALNWASGSAGWRLRGLLFFHPAHGTRRTVQCWEPIGRSDEDGFDVGALLGYFLAAWVASAPAKGFQRFRVGQRRAN